MNLFYNSKVYKDILFVVIKDLETTSYVIEDNIVVIYNNEEIIGYNFLNISSFIKIHFNGLFYYPPKEIIDLLNNKLLLKGLMKLEYPSSSGFYAAKVVDKKEYNGKDLYTLEMNKSRYYALNNYSNLNIDDMTIININNSRMINGRIFKNHKIENININCHILSNNDLKLNGDYSSIKIEDDTKEGEDVFK